MSESKKTISKKRVLGSAIVFLIMIGVTILSYELLGRENLMPAIMMVVQAQMIMLAKIDEKPVILGGKVLAMNLGLCLAGTLAAMNIWLGIFLNIIAVFSAATLLYREKGMQVYYPFMLCYLYMMVASPVTFDHIGKRLIMLVCGALLVCLVQIVSIKHVKDEDATIANFMRGFEIDTRSVRFSYAFRLTLGITLTWFIVSFFDIEYGKWLVISVNSIVMPDISKASVKYLKRIAGAFVGACLFFLVFGIVDSAPVEFAVMALASFTSIFFAKRYEIKTTCFSFMSLSAIAFAEPANAAFVIDRPIFVLIGGLVGMIINLTLLRRDETEAEPV